jgi:hypothetical protein
MIAILNQSKLMSHRFAAISEMSSSASLDAPDEEVPLTIEDAKRGRSLRTSMERLEKHGGLWGLKGNR